MRRGGEAGGRGNWKRDLRISGYGRDGRDPYLQRKPRNSSAGIFFLDGQQLYPASRTTAAQQPRRQSSPMTIWKSHGEVFLPQLIGRWAKALVAVKNSARSGRGELSNTRLNRAETALLVTPSFTVLACTNSPALARDSSRPLPGIAPNFAMRDPRNPATSFRGFHLPQRPAHTYDAPSRLPLLFEHLPQAGGQPSRLAQQPRRLEKTAWRPDFHHAWNFAHPHARPCQRHQTH